MKNLEDIPNYTTVPIIGTYNIHSIDSNIYITLPRDMTNFNFVYSTLLYTNMKYRISSEKYNSFHRDDLKKFKEDYIKENNIKENSKEMKTFEELCKEIYLNYSFEMENPKYYKLFNNNKFPIPLCNYKSHLKKDGYFLIDMISDNHYPYIKSAYILTDFINIDFSNYDNYFEFFTKYFLSFINFFEEKDRKSLKAYHLYTFSKIENLAKKYQDVVLSETLKYQTLFKNFIDYTYNYTNDKDIVESNNISFNAMKRFLIFRRTNYVIFDHLINNIITTNQFDVELFPVDPEKICEKKELIKKFNIDRAGVNWGSRSYATNIFSYFYYIFYNTIFGEKYIIKKCKNCNKYFYTNFDSTQLYCDNIFTKNQTCKDIGNQIAQLKKQKHDIVYGKYRKLYSKKAMLVKRNPDIESYKAEYENWKKEAQEYRDKLKKEEITNEEFEKWLDNNI